MKYNTYKNTHWSGIHDVLHGDSTENLHCFKDKYMIERIVSVINDTRFPKKCFFQQGKPFEGSRTWLEPSTFKMPDQVLLTLNEQGNKTRINVNQAFTIYFPEEPGLFVVGFDLGDFRDVPDYLLKRGDLWHDWVTVDRRGYYIPRSDFRNSEYPEEFDIVLLRYGYIYYYSTTAPKWFEDALLGIIGYPTPQDVYDNLERAMNLHHRPYLTEY